MNEGLGETHVVYRVAWRRALLLLQLLLQLCGCRPMLDHLAREKAVSQLGLQTPTPCSMADVFALSYTA